MSSFFDKLKKKKLIGGDDDLVKEEASSKKGGESKDKERDTVVVKKKTIIKEESLAGAGTMDVDILRTPTELVIFSPIAGVHAEDLDVAIYGEGDILVIKAERKRPDECLDAPGTKETAEAAKAGSKKEAPKEAPKTVTKGKFISQECAWGKLYRRLDLPEPVDTLGIEATLHKGVLILRLPLHKSTDGKRIEVIEKNDH